MSQSSQSRKSGPPPRQNPLPAILSALVVVAIFIVLGFVLASNRPGEGQTAAAPTTDAFSAVPPGDVAPTTAGAPAETAPTAVVPAGAAPAAQPQSYSAAPPMTIDPAKTYAATFTTPRGDFVVNLRPDLAPQTVNSFVFLANAGYFNGLTWHRVLP
ncbi:MAG: peptidylprolyl isomerase, partial [Roseiflexaceae bacterium]